jgi:Flp pilus assembly pilin Flp
MLTLYLKLENALQSMNDESGQDLIEYALLGALISVACVAAITPLATQVSATFTALTSAL